MTTFSTLPVRRLQEHPEALLDRNCWPATLPPVRQILDDGLELGSATVLAGDNGNGKSTIVEALAAGFGLNPGAGAAHTLPSIRPAPQSQT